MNENFYASPEVVQHVDSDELREYRRTLGMLARGLMWMVLGAVIGLVAALATEIFFWRHGPVLINIGNMVFVIVFGAFQLLGAVTCWLGAGFVKSGRLLIAACWMLVPVAFFFLFTTGVEPPILALLAFGFSCWCWQVFLLRLAYKVESRWLTWNAWLVIAAFSLAGFATLFVLGMEKLGLLNYHYGVPPTPFEEFMETCQSVCIGTGVFSGIAYFILYTILLIGLWKRLWSLIARSWEGGNHEE